jgi:hypothetical protein
MMVRDWDLPRCMVHRVRDAWFSRPGEEHRAGFGYVRDDEVQPRVVKLLVHEQQREPERAVRVVDTGRAMAGVSEFP